MSRPEGDRTPQGRCPITAPALECTLTVLPRPALASPTLVNPVMASPSNRPAPFPPGTPLSEHYTVEGLVRLAEGRMFYLANDDRPDRPRRFCWECGSDDTARSDKACVSCGASFEPPRRFLVSVRWDPEGYEPFSRFFEKHLEHPALVAPVDMFFQNGVLCSVTPWTGEGLLVDEGAPLAPTRVVELHNRLLGLTAFLHKNGVRLRHMTPAHFLVRDGQDVLLFDPEVLAADEAEVAGESRSGELPSLAELSRRFTPVEEETLQQFFLDAERGTHSSPLDFGRAFERLLDADFDGTTNGVGAMSDVGLSRSLNEDNWGWAHLRDGINLYVVADGMGGHDAGEVASEMAVANICIQAQNKLSSSNTVRPEQLENILEESFRNSNNAIKDHSEAMGNDMGTTMVAAMVLDERLAYVANVGDSRGYLMRQGVLHQVTRDHSLVARMVEQNRISREEARTHPHANILLRTVGTERDVDVDIFSVELEKDDVILLCSDGLWGEVEDEDIEAILNHYPDPRICCRELVRAAHHGGGKDNVTVMLVHVD